LALVGLLLRLIACISPVKPITFFWRLLRGLRISKRKKYLCLDSTLKNK